MRIILKVFEIFFLMKILCFFYYLIKVLFFFFGMFFEENGYCLRNFKGEVKLFCYNELFCMCL